MSTTILLRRGTAEEWAAANPVLASGEPGFDTTERLLKVGDGSTPWADLSGYLDEVAIAELLDALPAPPETRADLTGWPLFLYGNSYTVLQGSPTFTEGGHYSQLAAGVLNGGQVTSYGQPGRRAVEAALGAINGAAFPGATAPEAGSRWPGVAQRDGVVIVDTLVNDVAHGPTAGNAPTAIPDDGRYAQGIASALRTLLALMSTESRVEQHQFVAPTDAWSEASDGYWSDGSAYSTTTRGRRLSLAATPPQSGPLAGIVHLLVYKTDPAVLRTADLTITVDDGAAVPVPMAQWEQYTGNSGAPVAYCPHVVPVEMPIDGAAHTVTVAHDGADGEQVVVDALLVPSAAPGPIAVLDAPVLTANDAGWTSGQVSTWKANHALLTPLVEGVVGEFPHAIWVPSNVTDNGLWSGDGIHLNDRGQAQRSADLVEAVQGIKARLDARALDLRADGSFGVV